MQSFNIHHSNRSMVWPLKLLFFSAFLLGCEPDECAINPCENGGECVNGQCECPEDFSGRYCEEYNPCQHGGTFEGTSCDCSERFEGDFCERCKPWFEGENCEIEKNLNSFQITEVRLKRFPPFNYDLTPNWGGDMPEPDVFIIINQNNSAQIFSYSLFFTDAKFYETLTWPVNDFLLPTVFRDIGTDYTITFYDSDSQTLSLLLNQPMKTSDQQQDLRLTFSPSTWIGIYPKTLSYCEDEFCAEIDIDWRFD